MNTYSVNAGNTDQTYCPWVDAETLTICENYARSWIARGDDYWCEIVRDRDGVVVQYHEGRPRESDLDDLLAQAVDERVLLPSAEYPDGVYAPRIVVDEINAIFREHGIAPIETIA